MDMMEVDDNLKSEVGEEKAKRTVVMLVGPPGSGKSTFCDGVMRSSAQPWVRVCQDTINNGKAGTRAQCLKMAVNALKGGKCVLIDRCNLDKEQRSEFIKLGGPDVEVHAVVLDLPAQLCISRSVKRTAHEGNLQGGKAAAVINRMLQKKELPTLSEGFSRITFCLNENDVQNAVKTYNVLGVKDTLTQGCFGQKKPGAKVQLGIMKFLKKADAPVSSSKEPDSQVAASDQTNKEAENKHVNPPLCSSIHNGSEDCFPTLAFPSISTADFQFDLEKASDIIVQTVEEFVGKLQNAKLIMVDISQHSKILSLVKTKATRKNIDSQKFFTFAGDITKLNSEKGLRCNVIANAANWRLKPGGGGVNAAIFKAAGPDLEAATKEQAKCLQPGKSVVVPLPSASPLHGKEGVTHVIHVLGPNMNPNRPNCLNNDYTEGCRILREAYTSLFNDFLSIVNNQAKLPKRSNECMNLGSSVPSSSNQEMNVDTDRSKKYKALKDAERESRAGKGMKNNEKNNSKGWASWSQALYIIAMRPEKHEQIVLEASNEVVVINDLYPKARKHLLVLAREEGLDRLSDVGRQHLSLLRKMHDEGLKWANKFLNEDASLIFRFGYHSVPSMRQLHLHVISQDFKSDNLKNKKHWNSFTTEFFIDSVDVMDEIESRGSVTVRGEDVLLKELRCHRCRSAHPNIPKLKSHILKCTASFPADLMQKDRLVFAPSSNTESKD